MQINEQIRDAQIRVIGADGAQLGVMTARAAQDLADEAGLDLVKIAPAAVPPVCRIMDYGKFRFEQAKKEKEARKNQHIVDIKEVRLGLNIDIGDFNTKVAQATKFLQHGDKVKASIRFRGREMAHPELGLEPMRRFAEARENYPETVEALCAAAAQAVEIAPSLSRAMADTVGPQGVFCTVRSPMALDDRPILDNIDTTGRYVVLEDIRDPGNLGTMIRAAEAFGLNGLLLSDGCCDVGNPKVLRGSMGGVFRLPLLAAGSLPETIAALQARGMTAYACVVDPGARPVDTAGVTAPGSLCAVGNEGSGLRPETVAACAQRVTIRMAGRAESLNASLAAGIVMWEMVRPR